MLNIQYKAKFLYPNWFSIKPSWEIGSVTPAQYNLFLNNCNVTPVKLLSYLGGFYSGFYYSLV